MKTDKFNTISKILFLSILFGYILYIVVKSYNDKIERNLKTKYTIGKVENIRARANLDYALDFSFNVNNITFDAIWGVESVNKALIGSRFFVKFESGNPDNCEILLDKPVPDSIKEAPPEGWDKIP